MLFSDASRVKPIKSNKTVHATSLKQLGPEGQVRYQVPLNKETVMLQNVLRKNNAFPHIELRTNSSNTELNKTRDSRPMTLQVDVESIQISQVKAKKIDIESIKYTILND